MTDSEEKSGPPEKSGLPEKSSSPSTLEKAVAKVSKNRKAKNKARAQGTKGGANGETQAAADPPRRSVRRQIIGALSADAPLREILTNY